MKLENMSLEKLWEVFPITFIDNTDNFKDIYLDEEKNLKSLLGNYITRISHIGSTSIINIKTKPIIDILVEIDFDNKDIVDLCQVFRHIFMDKFGGGISSR